MVLRVDLRRGRLGAGALRGELGAVILAHATASSTVIASGAALDAPGRAPGPRGRAPAPPADAAALAVEGDRAVGRRRPRRGRAAGEGRANQHDGDRRVAATPAHWPHESSWNEGVAGVEHDRQRARRERRRDPLGLEPREPLDEARREDAALGAIHPPQRAGVAVRRRGRGRHGERAVRHEDELRDAARRGLPGDLHVDARARPQRDAGRVEARGLGRGPLLAFFALAGLDLPAEQRARERDPPDHRVALRVERRLQPEVQGALPEGEALDVELPRPLGEAERRGARGIRVEDLGQVDLAVDAEALAVAGGRGGARSAPACASPSCCSSATTGGRSRPRPRPRSPRGRSARRRRSPAPAPRSTAPPADIAKSHGAPSSLLVARVVADDEVPRLAGAREDAATARSASGSPGSAAPSWGTAARPRRPSARPRPSARWGWASAAAGRRPRRGASNVMSKRLAGDERHRRVQRDGDHAAPRRQLRRRPAARGELRRRAAPAATTVPGIGVAELAPDPELGGVPVVDAEGEALGTQAGRARRARAHDAAPRARRPRPRRRAACRWR